MNNITNPLLVVCYHSIKEIISGDYDITHQFGQEVIRITDWSFTGCPSFFQLRKLVDALGCVVEDAEDEDEYVLEVYAK